MKKLFFLIAIIIFAIEIASADSIILGKVYHSDFIHPIKDANISIECGGIVQNSKTIGDGSYAVIFQGNNCSLNSDINVLAIKISSYAFGFGKVVWSFPNYYVGVVNINMSVINGCDGADINDDGVVNLEDLHILSQNYNKNNCSNSNSWCENADINKDGLVNFSDLLKLSQNYNRKDCHEPFVETLTK